MIEVNVVKKAHRQQALQHAQRSKEGPPDSGGLTVSALYSMSAIQTNRKQVPTMNAPTMAMAHSGGVPRGRRTAGIAGIFIG
jgi:hypothetical protein